MRVLMVVNTLRREHNAPKVPSARGRGGATRNGQSAVGIAGGTATRPYDTPERWRTDLMAKPRRAGNRGVWRVLMGGRAVAGGVAPQFL
jgi:hypothetical protein